MTAATIDEILEQVKQLSHNQRKELTKQMIDLLDQPVTQDDEPTDQHWGRNLVRLLNSFESLDPIHPEIEDPVEWVKTIRREDELRRRAAWDLGTDPEEDDREDE